MVAVVKIATGLMACGGIHRYLGIPGIYQVYTLLSPTPRRATPLGTGTLGPPPACLAPAPAGHCNRHHQASHCGCQPIDWLLCGHFVWLPQAPLGGCWLPQLGNHICAAMGPTPQIHFIDFPRAGKWVLRVHDCLPCLWGTPT